MAGGMHPESPSHSRDSLGDGDSAGGAAGGGAPAELTAEDVARQKDKNRVAQKKFRQRQKVRTLVP